MVYDDRIDMIDMFDMPDMIDMILWFKMISFLVFYSRSLFYVA